MYDLLFNNPIFVNILGGLCIRLKNFFRVELFLSGKNDIE